MKPSEKKSIEELKQIIVTLAYGFLSLFLGFFLTNQYQTLLALKGEFGELYVHSLLTFVLFAIIFVIILIRFIVISYKIKEEKEDFNTENFKEVFEDA